MTEFEEYTLRGAIERFGVTKQLIKLMEECGELVQAAGKCLEAQGAEAFGQAMDHIAEEMADVGILIDQFRLLFPDVIEEPVRDWRVKKIDRLAERLEAECDAEDKENVCALWNRRDEPPNPPLTPDELRELP